MCILNYLAIDRNNGGITQKIDSPGGRTGFFPYFLEECMKKSFHKFYVGTVDKLKPARPTMVGIRRKFLGILYINLYLHLSGNMGTIPYLGIYILTYTCIALGTSVSESDGGKTFSSRRLPHHLQENAVTNQIPVSVECKGLIAKVDCSSFHIETKRRMGSPPAKFYFQF